MCVNTDVRIDSHVSIHKPCLFLFEIIIFLS